MQVEDFSTWGQIARVRHINGSRVYVELSNGSVAWVELDVPLSIAVNAQVILFEDRLEEAPVEAWPEKPWVAVVKIKREDTTVIEFSGHIGTIPTNDVPYEEGNTVEVLAAGVVRVLSERPLRVFDLPAVGAETVEQFVFDPSAGNLTFDDFGGLPEVVERAREIIETPLKYRKQLEEIGARSVKGVLFTGEPGTGKTMLARIIAQQSSAVFYHVSGPEILSKWYGQSEELLRELFVHAERQDNGAIIFFDEIDSLAAQRDEDAHEASKRLVAQLLTLMDGFSANSNVVVIAATNRVQDIDTALRRPGRFDWEIKFPLPSLEDRAAILTASSRRLKIFGDLTISQAAIQTEGWSAADLTAIWTEAALLAAADSRGVIMEEDFQGGIQRLIERIESKSREAHGRS